MGGKVLSRNDFWFLKLPWFAFMASLPTTYHISMTPILFYCKFFYLFYILTTVPSPTSLCPSHPLFLICVQKWASLPWTPAKHGTSIWGRTKATPSTSRLGEATQRRELVPKSQRKHPGQVLISLLGTPQTVQATQVSDPPLFLKNVFPQSLWFKFLGVPPFRIIWRGRRTHFL